VLKLNKTEERSNYAEEKGGKLSFYILNSCFKIHENTTRGSNEKEGYSRLLEQTNQNLDELIH